MKQSSGCLVEEMEKELEVCEVLCQLGLLVVESRQPELSPRGRMEGPHCPTKLRHHECNTVNDLCKKKDMIEREILSLWKNKVPICIEVLMLPACQHGSHLAAMSDMSINSLKGKCLLLEQWKIQEVHKRMSESVVSVYSLFQAVKSYLYFSQLSAWLNKSKGNLPANIAYRICPPGDFCTSTFHKRPELHQFPLTSKNGTSPVAIQVSISALPRQDEILIVPCPAIHGTVDAESKQQPNEEDDALEEGAHGDGITFSMATNDSKSVRHRSSSYCADCDYDLSLVQQPLTLATVTDTTFTTEPLDSDISSNNAAAINYAQQPFTPFTASSRLTPPTRDQHDVDKSSVVNPPVSLAVETAPNIPTLRAIHDTKPSSDISNISASNGASSDILSLSEDFSSSSNGATPVLLVGQKVSPVKEVQSRSSDGKAQQLNTNTSSFNLVYSEEKSSIAKGEESPVIFYAQSDWVEEATEHLVISAEPSLTDHSQSSLVLPGSNTDTDHLKQKQTESKNLQKPMHEPFRQNHRFSPEFENGSSDGEYSFSEIDNILSQALNTQLSLDNSPNGILNFSKICGSHNSSSHSSGGSSNSIAIQSSQSSNGYYKSSDHSNYQADTEVFRSPSALPKSFQEYHHNLDQSSNRTHRNVPPTPPSTLMLDTTNTDFTNGKSNNANDQCSIIKALAPTKSSRMPRRSFPSAPENISVMALVTPHRPKAPPLLKAVMGNEFANEQVSNVNSVNSAPSEEQQQTFRRNLCKSAAAVFNTSTGLPLQSSPAPIKKKSRLSFDFDENLVSVKAIKNSVSCVNLDELQSNNPEDEPKKKKVPTATLR